MVKTGCKNVVGWRQGCGDEPYPGETVFWRNGSKGKCVKCGGMERVNNLMKYKTLLILYRGFMKYNFVFTQSGDFLCVLYIFGNTK